MNMSLQAQPPMETFIDHLPEELLPVITKKFFGFRMYQTALSFAQGSETRRRCVVEGLLNKLFLKRTEAHLLPDLIQMFGDQLHEIFLIFPIKLSHNFSLPNLPRTTSLRKASILSNKQQLEFVKGNTSLTSLTIQVHPQPRWSTLTATLQTLPLSYLRLQLIDGVSPPSKRIRRRLIAACQGITELIIDGESGAYSKFWPIISMISSLKILAVKGNVRGDNEREFMKNLEQVELASEIALQDAIHIGTPMVSIRQISPEEKFLVARLDRCPKLENLRIALKDEAETGLLGKVGNLETLEIWWGGPVRAQIDSFLTEETQHYEPDSDFLIELLESAPKLQNLGLIGAVVKSPVIEQILKMLGDRLTSFTIHMDSQMENTPKRLVLILNSLARWCPNLKKLSLRGICVEVRATAAEKHACLVAYAKLRRRCPHLSFDLVRLFIFRFRLVAEKRQREDPEDTERSVKRKI